MEIHWKNGSSRNEEGAISKVLAARTVAKHCFRIQAGLGVSVVKIVGCQKTMPREPYIAYFQFQISGRLTLDREVVRREILTSHLRLNLPERQNGAKHPQSTGCP